MADDEHRVARQHRAYRTWRRLRAPVQRELAKLGYPAERMRTRRLPDYPNQLLFIAGLPKSGTNWLAHLLENVPGYRQRSYHDRDHCMREHDICDGVLGSLPGGLYSILRTHTRWTPENVAILKRRHVKTVVLHRDLRDQVVSRAHHVLKDPRHHMHSDYRSLSMDEAIADSIDVAIESYVPWVSDWLEQTKRDPASFHELRYEDLHANPVGAFRRVLAFYEIQLSEAEAAAIVERVQAQTRFGLTERSLLAGSTARRGAVGDWRNYFTPEHIERFKAGAGELLIRLGQEQDMDWGVTPATGDAVSLDA